MIKNKFIDNPVVRYRYQVVKEVIASSISAVSRKYNLSRPTVRSWIDRFDQEGLEGFLNKPRGNRTKVPKETIDLIVDYKLKGLHRSARKIQELLEENHKIKLHRKTIWQILKDHGLNRTELPDKEPIKPFEAENPNDLWQIDFIEDERVTFGLVNLPLVVDDCSRYIVGGEFVVDKSQENMLKVLMDAFEENGLPKAILSDRGIQFIATGKKEAITRYQEILSMLGVKAIFARAYSPRTKGKVEKLNQFIQRDFLMEVRDSVKDLKDLNKQWRKWVKKYNTKHKHRSLDSKPPASIYRPGRPIELNLNLSDIFTILDFRKVRRDATIVYKDKSFKVPKRFVGSRIWFKILDGKLQLLDKDKVIKKYPL